MAQSTEVSDVFKPLLGRVFWDHKAILACLSSQSLGSRSSRTASGRRGRLVVPEERAQKLGASLKGNVIFDIQARARLDHKCWGPLTFVDADLTIYQNVFDPDRVLIR